MVTLQWELSHCWNTLATVGTEVIVGTHGYTTMGTEATVGTCNSGNRSLLRHIVTTVGTEITVGSQQ
jgi:hypothetical protein